MKTERMDGKTCQSFFELLRDGLWGCSTDAGLMAGTDWKALMDTAARQTVAGLVAQGICNLAATAQVPRPVINRALYVKSHNRACHALLNKSLEGITSLLHWEGIRCVLLKGQGLAAFYPNATLRTCGDIDLWIGHEAYGRACHKAMQWNSQGTCIDGQKHFHFHYKGVPVELHRITERMPFGMHNKLFGQLTEEKLQPGNCPHVFIDGNSYEIPPDDYNVVYVFNHFFHHFMLGGISLRQLCDWALLLNATADNIDQCVLEQRLRSFGLWRAWHLFGSIAVETLGLPAHKMPFYSLCHPGKQQALSFILDAGNFGRYRTDTGPRPESYWGGKRHSLKGNMQHFRNFLTILPQETAAYGTTFLYRGITNILKRQK